ncbi:MAG TPA: NADH:ubiquinone reductase (Na(+)-transporting) subunit B [Usitatibacteraceae bacterium]|nr:NADH:ubiquinone reductase (Na(+)-transporting) subunit B [Usitatibacteraceae bacterium]
MNALERLLEKAGRPFGPGKPLARFYALFEAADTFALTPPSVTAGITHVRDALDLKRMMMIVVIAMMPCILMAMYNTGLQANLAIDPAKAAALEGWRHDVMRLLGAGYSPQSVGACFLHGSLYFLPLYAITMAAGGLWEVLFAIVRRHEVNEGFFVTGLIFPLTLPPTMPLWEAALGISFGVVVAKEVFGGTGMNFINPALAARAFVFFAYPGDISGDQAWTAVPPGTAIDGFSGATLLGQMRQMTGPFEQQGYSWTTAFLGFEKGSLGETSALACLAGAIFLIVTRVGSWHTMAGAAAGTAAMALLFNAIGSSTNPWFAVPFWWHMVLGGWAFGMAFMATDPVTSPFTEKGRLVYGFLIGVFVVLIRVVNPAYPEAVMLVILFMNVMAPLIDYGFVKANIVRRARRGGARGET